MEPDPSPIQDMQNQQYNDVLVKLNKILKVFKSFKNVKRQSIRNFKHLKTRDPFLRQDNNVLRVKDTDIPLINVLLLSV